LVWNEHCHAPDTTDLELFAREGDVITKLSGKWWYCGGDGPFDGAMEIVGDQRQYFLLALDAGVLVRRTDVDSSGQFWVTAPQENQTQSASSTTFQLAFATAHGLAIPSASGTLAKTPSDKMTLGSATYVRVP
jgi:hypothetical protein